MQIKQLYGVFFKLLVVLPLLHISLLLPAQANPPGDRKVSLNAKNIMLEDLFNRITRQTGVLFTYSNEVVNKSTRISIDVTNQNLQYVLTNVLAGRGLEWTYQDNVVIIRKAIDEQQKKSNPVTGLGKEDTLLTITGRVVDTAGTALPAVSVQVKGTAMSTITNAAGEFALTIQPDATLIISSISHQPQEVKLRGRNNLLVTLQPVVRDLKEVTVYNTGYQFVAKERAPGSFTQVNNELLNRSVSTNILDRLNGVASGVLFNANTSDAGFSIRGRSTIFANTSPAIILDNFAYDGDISTINPNDVESITILKDAQAASIWGVRASNGVVVITTKKGKYNQPLRVSVNANVTIGEKPHLYGRPDMAVSDIIDVETFLFDKGAYVNAIATPSAALSPVVEILLKKQNGVINAAEAENQLNILRKQNTKDDLLKYYYRKTVNQQYAVNLSGGSYNNKYYLSVGYDRNLQSLVSDVNDRLTINAQNTYGLLKNKLEATAGITFSSSKTTGNAGGIINPTVDRPYQHLADDKGNALIIYPYRQAWTDTIGSGKLLDWNWRPLDELHRKNYTSALTNYLLNTALKYTIIKGLEATILYQYSRGNTENNTLHSQESFYTRDLINQYSQLNYTTGTVTRPIPLGDILDRGTIVYKSQNLRGQLSYNKLWGSKHALNTIAGAEIKDYNVEINNNRLYGYNKSLGSIANIDYTGYYPNLINGFYNQIPGTPMQTGTTDRYISYYANAAYTYNNRYTLSASARKDESNLFGVKANQKGVPLWSVGGSWQISKENFYNVNWMPNLTLRLTNGYNGNVDKTVSAFTTAVSIGNNKYGALSDAIINPPNPSLRWEKINITNIGVDFGLFKDRITGSIEYYTKKGKDIIGNSPLPPSSGVVQFKGNSADIRGNGIDVVINTRNVEGNFAWSTTLLFSRNTDKITEYKVNTGALSFHKGYPFNGIFSYRWAGLDPLTGDPQGYQDGHVSKNWPSIINADSIGNTTMYNGPGVPTYFGSLRNSFSWYNFSLSINIVYKLGYYFRAASIDYSSLLGGSLAGHKDYSFRWQQPADEKVTSVPSMIYPYNFSREIFYANSEVLVQKGDHIRLQDVQLSYNLSRRSLSGLPFVNARLYVYANNLGIIWRANSKGIDPDNQITPISKTIAAGLKIDF